MQGLSHACISSHMHASARMCMHQLTWGIAGRPSGWPGVLEKSAPLPTSVATSLGAVSTECMSAVGSPVSVAMLSSVSLTCGRMKRQGACTPCQGAGMPVYMSASRRLPSAGKHTAYPTMLAKEHYTRMPLDARFSRHVNRPRSLTKQRKTCLSGPPS
jgi:hypothetical protein